jgi:hypothetical protein
MFLKKRDSTQNPIKETKILNKNLQPIIKSIEETSDEQREIVKKFRLEMENFVTERSLESCVKTLNLSMQLANVREQLLETYKQYIAILELELKTSLKNNNDSNK